MKKQIAILSALAVVSFAAAPANALFLPSISSLVNKAKTAINGGIKSVGAAVKKAGNSAIKMGADLAHKGVDALKDNALQMLDKAAGMAKELTGKAHEAAIRNLEGLANKLPGPFQKLAKSGIKALDKDVLSKLHEGINGAIDHGQKLGHTAISKLTKGAHKTIGGFSTLLKDRFNQGVEHAQKVATGAVKRGGGIVNGLWNKGKGRAEGIVKAATLKFAKFNKPAKVKSAE